MDQKEWVEAENALEQLLPKIDAILVELDKAKNWGFWDLLGGGGLSGLIKRDKIYKANQKLDQLRLYLMDVQKELGDVNLTLTNIPDSNSDFMLDIVFDNIFTDLRVQDEVKTTYQEVTRLKAEVLTVLHKVQANR